MPAKKSTKKKRQAKPSKRRRGTTQADAKSARRHSAHPKTVSPAQTVQRAGKAFADLVTLMMRLRGPGGCPWDIEQTNTTLRTYLIEETYEVLAALDNGDDRELTEELGDLLLQIVFHSEIARQEGRFDIVQVVSEIHEKMVRRHPHVFGDVHADTAEQVLKNWEKVKLQEKAKARGSASPSELQYASVLKEIPRSLPALLEAYQMTRRAAKVGFDWKSIDGIFEKLHEETAELQQALSSSDEGEREEEVGDLLFVLVNLSRFLGFDPEVALKRTNRKFKSRFNTMEAAAASAGHKLADMPQEQQEELWQNAKATLKESRPPRNP